MKSPIFYDFSLGQSLSFEYICHGSTAIVNNLILSKSDVHRRQISTYKYGPRPERVKKVSKVC